MRSGWRGRTWLALLAALTLVAPTTTACSSSSPRSAASGPGSSSASARASARPVTIRVPQDARTISAALRRISPGGLVLVSPGVYHETAQIRTPRVTLRGTDRNTVIIDGDVLRPNGVVLTGAGDAVQNLTVRHASLNGVLITGATDAHGAGIGKGSTGYSTGATARFPPVKGFLVDHVTSYNNGLYGVYAFDATDGAIVDSYTSGMADSGIYVGQCKPCGIAVHGNVAERNAVGYEGTNASGRMYVYGNRFVGNRVGGTTNSDHQEALVPQTGALISGNVVAANSRAATPEQADGGFGIGFGIAGGNDNMLSKNLIEANPVVGVEITNADDLAASDNKIVGNTFARNRLDFAFASSAAAAGRGNCLQANSLASVRPRSFPTSCPSSVVAAGVPRPSTNAPPGIAFTDVPAPPALPNLGAATTAPAAAIPALPDPATIAGLPVPPSALLQNESSTRW